MIHIGPFVVTGEWLLLCVAIGAALAITVGFFVAWGYLGSPQRQEDYGKTMRPNNFGAVPTDLTALTKAGFLFGVPAMIVVLLGLGVYYAFIK
jgi:hypothetical protein